MNLEKRYMGIILLLVCSFIMSQAVMADYVEKNAEKAFDYYINTPPSGLSSTDPIKKVLATTGYTFARLYRNIDTTNANASINWIYDNYPIPITPAVDYHEDFPAFFSMPMLWRMYLDHSMNSRLTQDSKDDIEDMMWDWIYNRSKISEAEGSVWKIRDSENYDVLHKIDHLIACEALINAGSPYGASVQLADGYTIEEHRDAWQKYFFEYFRQRAREGINCEIASPGYAGATLETYYNLYDYSSSDDLSSMAEDFITLYWADYANDYLSGAGRRGGAETRAYKGGAMEALETLKYVPKVYGWHGSDDIYSSMQPDIFILLASGYRCPEIVNALASQITKAPSMYSSRRFGKGGSWSIPYRVYTASFGDENSSDLRRDSYVHRDYIIGGLTLDTSDNNYISLIDQNRLMGVFYDSSPTDRILFMGGESSSTYTTLFDIWGVCRERCLVAAKDPAASASMRIFLADGDLVDNKVEEGGWIFTRTGPSPEGSNKYIMSDRSTYPTYADYLLLGPGEDVSGEEPGITTSSSGYGGTGEALDFDGANDLAISNPRWHGFDSVELDFYIKADSLSSSKRILMDAYNIWQVSITNDDMTFTIWTSSTSTRSLTIYNNLSIGTWQHVQASIDPNGVLSFDFGGTHKGTGSGTPMRILPGTLTLGSKSSGSYYSGLIDEVEITIPSSGKTFAKWDMDQATCRDVYTGIYIANGSYDPNTTTNSYGLILDLVDDWSPVVFQTGSVEDYGSFANFKNSVKANYIDYDATAGKLTYISEDFDKYEFWANNSTTPRVNDNAVELNPTKTYDSPYIQGDHGSDKVTISIPEYSSLYDDLVLDFCYHESPQWDDYQTVALWHMDSTTSGQMIDDDLENDGRNNNLILYGPIVTTNEGGVFGEALEFDGVDDYGIVDGWPGNDSFKADMWVYPTGSSGYNVIVAARNRWSVGISNGKLDLTTWNSNSYAGILSWPTNIVLNEWHHVVALCDENGHREIWLDGESISDEVGAGLLTGSSHIDIGDKPGYSRYFEGKIDDVKITKYYITEADESQGNFADDGATVGLWHFESTYEVSGVTYHPDDDSANPTRNRNLKEYSTGDPYISLEAGGYDGTGYCVDFDTVGSNSYMLYGPQWPTDGDTFLYQGWIKIDTGEGGYLCHVYDQIWLHAYESTGVVTFTIDPDKTDSTDTVSITANIKDTNDWQFIKAGYDGEQIWIETEVETKFDQGTGPIVPYVRNIYIGSRKNANMFVGKMDEVKLSCP